MNCSKALKLLPGYAVGALSDHERAQLAQHLSGGHLGGGSVADGQVGDGCQSCQQELDELTAAASLLAESVTPIAPPPQLKLALLERINSEHYEPSSNRELNSNRGLNSDRASSLPSKSFVARSSWRTVLPYIAATLCATAVGSWVARSVDRSGADRLSNGEINQLPIGSSIRIDEWRKRIAAAEQAFGPPRVQLAKLETAAIEHGLLAAVFYDGLSGEYHVLVSNTGPPSYGQQLWLWLIDRQGARMSQGPLEYLGKGDAAGVFELNIASDAESEKAFELIITDEPQGDPAEPTGRVVGQARMSMGS